MAIERDINKKKNKEREPAQKATPMKPFKAFGKKGLKSPTYGRRNPHKDHGDKKPSLKTKASIIKEKAKKGQGLARGGMVKSIIKLIPGFAPVPRSGTVSTIQKSASAFVKRRKQTGPKSVMPIKKAMGGEASTSISRAELMMKNREKRRKETQEMLRRLYGKNKIVPKKKPLKKKDGGDIRERIQKDMIKRNPQDFDLNTGARLTDKAKMDRIKKARDKAKSKPKRKIF